MAQRELKIRMGGGLKTVSTKYYTFAYFKEGAVFLCKNILEKTRLSCCLRLALVGIPLRKLFGYCCKVDKKNHSNGLKIQLISFYCISKFRRALSYFRTVELI